YTSCGPSRSTSLTIGWNRSAACGRNDSTAWTTTCASCRQRRTVPGARPREPVRPGVEGTLLLHKKEAAVDRGRQLLLAGVFFLSSASMRDTLDDSPIRQ